MHLQGAVTQVSPTNTSLNLIGTLPAAASPCNTVYTIAHTLNGTYADVAITPQGQIFAIASLITGGHRLGVCLPGGDHLPSLTK